MLQARPLHSSLVCAQVKDRGHSPLSAGDRARLLVSGVGRHFPRLKLDFLEFDFFSPPTFLFLIKHLILQFLLLLE
jgi:hypothetical protein